MKISALFLLPLFFLFPLVITAQDDLDRMVEEGIALHDKGDYAGAISKYDSVLQRDSRHYYANYEKAYTLISMEKYEESIKLCKLLLEINAVNNNNKNVYVNWGTALDYLGKSEEAVKVYSKGLEAFPDFYMLHFNRAVTLFGLNQADKALDDLQKALSNNPLHAGTHRLLGLYYKDNNRIASMLSHLSFLMIEPEGKRAQQMYSGLNGLVMKGVSDNPDGKGTTINIDGSLLNRDKQKKENDFSSMELTFSLSSALDKGEKFKDQNEAEKLHRKLDMLMSSLKEGQKEGTGFYWKFYVPFLVDLQKKDYLLTCAYIVTLNSKDEAVAAWLKDNEKKVADFYEWLEGYKWGL